VSYPLAAFAALALLAVAGITRPWWRPSRGRGTARRAANIAAYRSRVAEIDRDAAAGIVSAEEAESLRTETAAQLLGDTGAADAAEAPPAAPSRWLAVLVAVAVPAFAAVWYWSDGSWRVAQQLAQAGASTQVSPQVQAMVEKLAARMQAHPDDPAGWAMLGRSYFVMRRYAEAAGAYHQANAHNGGKDPDLLASEGEALSFANGTEVPDDAAALFDRALKLDANDARALWYGGLAEAQRGDFTGARQRWTRLRQQALPDPMKKVLDRQLAQLDAMLAGSGGAGAPAAGSGTAVAGAASAGASGSATAAAVSLPVTVELAPDLKGQVPSGATLFVFAKAESGPPMPLAVSRQPLAALPVQVTLDDGMAMAPGMNLSHFDRYVITARISASGQAQPQSGDLQGSIHVSRAASGQPQTLVIDQKVP
jgi:cytochrome c-type biogenesis protein CcmH